MKPKAYGAWPSPIDAGTITSATKGYAELNALDDALFWLESRPGEGGRSTLIHQADGVAQEITPAPFNPRSRVHEYGGGSYCVAGENVYFVHFVDQNIYSVSLADRLGKPRRITNGDAAERFGDLAWDGSALLAVRERHGIAAEPVNDLVRIDIATGRVAALHQGHDFYAAPRPAEGRVAFLVWDHPNMPWDGTQLLVADYDGERLVDATAVAGGATEAIVQPTWCGDRLVFATDADGYWNLFAYDASGVYCLLRDAAEYAGPAWQLGTTYFVPVGVDHLVARRVADGEPSLVVVDASQGLASPLHEGFTSYASLARTPKGVAFIAGSGDQPSQIVELRLADRACSTIAAGDAPPPAAVISTAERIVFPSSDGNAYAYVYPPRNGDCCGLDGELPPVLVTTHGGPTSATSASLNWGIQYYTSRGWAVADVDYGGSTGYGRAYRERLHGAWGQVDVADCVACVRHLIAEGQVDPARVAIRGGSAGGYTTLAALTFADVFRAGASHYGIGDLHALDRDTHKFESRYVGTLVGDAAAMHERSPIHHVERLNCPVIFFQGADDKVVPPNQSEAMRDALAAKGIPVAYLLFPGEGHGFRRAENARRAIEAEYAFFARVFGILPAEALPEVPIDNLPAAADAVRGQP